VPYIWPSARRTAALLIERAWASPPAAASFEYRATHDVLALTVLLTEFGNTGAEHRHDRLCMVMGRLEYDLEWALWCSDQLARAPARLAATDLDEAVAAWKWLTHSRLLHGSLARRPATYTGTTTRAGAGVSVGVAHAHRSLAVLLRAERQRHGRAARE
jgi:hypothetical protein